MAMMLRSDLVQNTLECVCVFLLFTTWTAPPPVFCLQQNDHFSKELVKLLFCCLYDAHNNFENIIEEKIISAVLSSFFFVQQETEVG